MDLKNIKEEVIRLLNSLFSKIEDSYWFYFLTEKYHALSHTHRRGLLIILSSTILIIVVYYPLLKLYSSYKNMDEFIGKKNIIQELNNLSSANQLYLAGLRQSPTDLTQFLKQEIQRIKISEQQIIQIKETENQKLKDIRLPVNIQTTTVEIDNLNLTEIVQHGYQLENLSDNLKMIDINITENPEKENYFRVTYTLSLFALARPILKQNQQVPQDKNDEIKPKTISKQMKNPSPSIEKPKPDIKPLKLNPDLDTVKSQPNPKPVISNPTPSTDVTIRQPIERSLQR